MLVVCQGFQNRLGTINHLANRRSGIARDSSQWSSQHCEIEHSMELMECSSISKTMLSEDADVEVAGNVYIVDIQFQ